MTSRGEGAHRSSDQLGLVGLGLIGSALTERLVAVGFRVLGYDLDSTRRAAALALGATIAGDATEILRSCDRVLLSLPSHREVEAVVEAGTSFWRPGTTVIDTTTGDPASARAMAQRLGARDVSYLDATISGSSTQARAGTAVLMVGGEVGAFTACADIFSGLAAKIFHTGASGTGSSMKLVTNLVLGLNRAALAEGLALARSMQLDLALTLEVMRAGGAYSRIMDTKGGRMITGEFTPEARLAQHLKDVNLIIGSGQQAGLPMPLSVAHRQVLEAAVAAGFGDLDNSAIIKVLSPRSP